MGISGGDQLGAVEYPPNVVNLLYANSFKAGNCCPSYFLHLKTLIVDIVAEDSNTSLDAEAVQELPNIDSEQ